MYIYIYCIGEVENVGCLRFAGVCFLLRNGGRMLDGGGKGITSGNESGARYETSKLSR